MMKESLSRWGRDSAYSRCFMGALNLGTVPPPDLGDHRVAPVRPDDLADPRFTVRADWFDAPRRLARGDRAWGLWRGDRLLSYGWSSTLPTRAGGRLRVIPGPGEVYLYSFFTDGRERGKGYYPLLLSRIAYDLSLEGHRLAWIAVYWPNLASLRGITKAGFHVASTVTVFAGHLCLHRVAPGMPKPMVRTVSRSLRLDLPLLRIG